MNRIFGLFIGLGILSLVFWMIEALFAAKPEQPRLFRRRGFKTDLVYYFATPLLTKSVSQVGIAVILVLIYPTDLAGVQAMLADRGTWLASLPAWIQGPAMLVVGDFIAYWLHRAFHCGRLWPFHAVHHSSVDLDWLSSVRLHPVNDWLTRWIQATSLIVLGFAPLAVAAYVPFLTLYAIMLHANVSWEFGGPFAGSSQVRNFIDGTIPRRMPGSTGTSPGSFQSGIFFSGRISCPRDAIPRCSA